jgi:hypothetical protein
VSERVAKAWREFGGNITHSCRCGPKNVDMRDAAPDDARCTCGLRELAEALDDVCAANT